VYKLLKPVQLPFVDFSDSVKRCDAARVEFECNQRISPDVYLGMADVVERDAVVDRMIVMRRLQAEHELRYLLGLGPQLELIHAVARHIARLHADLAPLRGSHAEPASVESVASNWEDNFTAIRAHVGAVIDAAEFDRVTLLARSYIAGRSELFAHRIDAGWVREGHGDLRAEHIYCTPSGPRLIDCVAFDHRLRVSDVLADVAFLAMDLDRLSGLGSAIALMGSWNEFTNESHPTSLAHFYLAYRAHVRCKIACMRHASGDPDAAREAIAYHEQVRRHLEHAQIRCVMVGGGAGSGKSTIASAAAEAVGAVWLRADEIRKDVAGFGHDDHDFSDPEEGIYSPDVTLRTQAEIARQAELLMRRGLSVVLDSTWRSAESRAPVRALATDCDAHITELQCDLPRAVAKERIARRMASVYNPSDATPELVDFIADRFDPWPEATTIDTSGTVAASVAGAMAAVLSQDSSPCAATPMRFTVDLTHLRNEILLEQGLAPSRRKPGSGKATTARARQKG